MSPQPRSKRPAPDAYDHLWALLPVFAAFVAVLVFFATLDDGLLGADRGTAQAPKLAAKPVARN